MIHILHRKPLETANEAIRQEIRVVAHLMSSRWSSSCLLNMVNEHILNIQKEDEILLNKTLLETFNRLDVRKNK